MSVVNRYYAEEEEIYINPALRVPPSSAFLESMAATKSKSFRRKSFDTVSTTASSSIAAAEAAAMSLLHNDSEDDKDDNDLDDEKSIFSCSKQIEMGSVDSGPRKRDDMADVPFAEDNKTGQDNIIRSAEIKVRKDGERISSKSARLKRMLSKSPTSGRSSHRRSSSRDESSSRHKSHSSSSQRHISSRRSSYSSVKTSETKEEKEERRRRRSSRSRSVTSSTSGTLRAFSSSSRRHRSKSRSSDNLVATALLEALAECERPADIDGKTSQYFFSKSAPKAFDDRYEELKAKDKKRRVSSSGGFGDHFDFIEDGGSRYSNSQDDQKIEQDLNAEENDQSIHVISRKRPHFFDRIKDERTKRRLLLVMACLLLMLLSASLVVGVRRPRKSKVDTPPTKPKENDEEVNRNSPPPRPVPPPPPNGDASNGDDFVTDPDVPLLTEEDLKSLLGDSIIKKATLSDPDTAESKAFNWILADSISASLATDSSYGPAKVTQRYTIVTLFHSTSSEDGWLENDGWMTPTHECSWHGIRCGADDSVEDSDGMMDLDGELKDRVTYIDLSENGLGGTLPEEMGAGLEYLGQLRLYDNSIGGKIPKSLFQLSNLHTLYLDKNKFTGNISGIGSLLNLQNLDLSNNQLTGTIENAIGNAEGLTDLRLSNNQLTGEFPIEIVELQSLGTLLLDNNQIEGTLPSAMFSMPYLVVLRLHRNEFFGTIPDRYESNILEEIHLDDNAFSGPIPTTFGSPELRELYLGGNLLTGQIPQDLGHLENIEILRLDSNKIKGTIPDSIGSLLKTREIHFEYNELEGDIPDVISNLVGLQHLHLDHNKLNGDFPNWIDSLPFLEHVHLNDNMLKGEIPEDLKFSDTLGEFTLERNEVTGIIPQSVCDLSLILLSVDCSEPAPRVECSCCTCFR
mmetsp:Transcript_11042/g.16013  ORF Transcript_11042/g.16013 Transcript_11042/m.16013 type:complete len:910 (+) Transcript_11042:389-3118(+)